MQIDLKRVDPEINMDRFYCVELTKDLFGAYGIHRQWAVAALGGVVSELRTKPNWRRNVPCPNWSKVNSRADIRPTNHLTRKDPTNAKKYSDFL